MKFYKKNSKIIDCLISVLCVVCIFALFYVRYPQYAKTTAFLIFSVFCILFVYFFNDKAKKIVKFIIKYRYLFSLIIFILCVVLKLHGSSMDSFKIAIDEGNSTVLYGESRSLRSDEWLVHTPYYFSQHYNDYKKSSKMMSLSGQDMIIGYNAPVKDISLISKPLTWGYVLLGNEYGLSWYWSLKMIILVLVSFELCRIITKGNDKLSLIGTLLVAYSPALQWWFIPHMTDVFIWSMLLCVLAYHFFTTDKTYIKNIITVLGALALSVFVLALFPGLQVPLGLIAFILFIVFLIRDKKEIKFGKSDIIRIIILVSIVGCILGYTLYDSKEAFKILNNTVYPGKRILTGGGSSIFSLFMNPINIFLPFKDSNVLNNCEVSEFIFLTVPFLIIFFPLIKGLKKKKEDNTIVGKTLVVFICVELLFMIVGFPRWLAKITLFSYINRMRLVYGFTSTLFTIWTISMIWKYPKIISLKQKLLSISVFVLGMILYCCMDSSKLEYLPIYAYLIEIGFFVLLMISIYQKREKLTTFLFIGLILLSSFTINPIARGASVIEDSSFAREVKKSVKDGGYALATEGNIMQQLLIANGIKTINAVNFYPDFKKWKLIDEKGENEFYYNRYAHIVISLTNSKTKYKKMSGDYIKVMLNVSDMKKWPVKCVVSPVEIDEKLDKAGIKYKKKFKIQYYIYTLE